MTSSQTQSASRIAFWSLVLPAMLILMITMGGRQTLGMFLSPLNTATGLGIANLALAMAVGQFVWGAAQPVFGAMADRYGPAKIIGLGGVLLASGLYLTSQSSSQWGLTVALGVLSAAGAGAGSFSILMGAAAQRLPVQSRSFASGLINAGGSLGQAVFAPLVAWWMLHFGWVNALWMLSVSALLTLILAWPLRGKKQVSGATGAKSITLSAQLALAFKDRSYWCLHAGFFTCGFHIAFLVTHLPQEVGLCGLPDTVSATVLSLIGLANIAGSLAIGWLGGIYRMKYLLFWMYFSRMVIIAIYLLAPKTSLTFYAFAIALGLTWLATVPPTAGLVGKLFGAQYLATLFGMTLLSHQIGGFLGAWLGGLALAYSGDYQWMWYADALLAVAAALVNLPIREPKLNGAALA
jgi:predicted MFS family arabinose efflux permease